MKMKNVIVNNISDRKKAVIIYYKDILSELKWNYVNITQLWVNQNPTLNMKTKVQGIWEFLICLKAEALKWGNLLMYQSPETLL